MGPINYWHPTILQAFYSHCKVTVLPKLRIHIQSHKISAAALLNRSALAIIDEAVAYTGQYLPQFNINASTDFFLGSGTEAVKSCSVCQQIFNMEILICTKFTAAYYCCTACLGKYYENMVCLGHITTFIKTI